MNRALNTLLLIPLLLPSICAAEVLTGDIWLQRLESGPVVSTGQEIIENSRSAELESGNFRVSFLPSPEKIGYYFVGMESQIAANGFSNRLSVSSMTKFEEYLYVRHNPEPGMPDLTGTKGKFKISVALTGNISGSDAQASLTSRFQWGLNTDQQIFTMGVPTSAYERTFVTKEFDFTFGTVELFTLYALHGVNSNYGIPTNNVHSDLQVNWVDVELWDASGNRLYIYDDFDFVIANSQGGPPELFATSGVPEPSSVFCLLSGMMLVAGRRSRGR